MAQVEKNPRYAEHLEKEAEILEKLKPINGVVRYEGTHTIRNEKTQKDE